jgi:YebC/PmpR family DNA-binding regulatory protein
MEVDNMSGHSKWAGIKHKKALVDAKRGNLFGKLARALTVAAREGGGDPDHNAALAQAILKAKDANMPHDNIDRAIKKGTGAGSEADSYHHLTYEGYGPNGVAIYVTALSDNKNRTAADIRHIFDRSGGKLGTDGSVSWMFERKGVIFVDAGVNDEDAVMSAAVDAGAEDVLVEGDSYEIRCDAAYFVAVRSKLQEAGIAFTSAELTMIPKNTIALDENDARKTLRLLDALEENDDVQEVFANFDVADEVMQALAG